MPHRVHAEPKILLGWTVEIYLALPAREQIQEADV
jgi:hypothetical protein